MNESRFARYRQLSAQLGGRSACALLDKLQELALMQPETLCEIEGFIAGGMTSPQRCILRAKPDRRQRAHHRGFSTISVQARRRAALGKE